LLEFELVIGFENKLDILVAVVHTTLKQQKKLFLNILKFCENLEIIYFPEILKLFKI
jgi:hypothetical protein